jgi:hypothetical protein
MVIKKTVFHESLLLNRRLAWLFSEQPIYVIMIHPKSFPIKYDVSIRVRFAYTDETGAKRRPAVILSTGDYHRGRQEAITAATTSNVQRPLMGDHLVKGWQGVQRPIEIDDPIERGHLLSMLKEIGSRIAFDLYQVRQRAEN